MDKSRFPNLSFRPALLPKAGAFPNLFFSNGLSWIYLAAFLTLWMSVPQAAAGQAGAAVPPCSVAAGKAVDIACEYAEDPSPTLAEDAPKIVLNRAALSFKTNDESFMRVELTFSNRGKMPFSSIRPVYLAIDDEAGNNLIRRLLTHVDFRTLVPGKPVTFSERLLVGALRPGHYLIHLWIPSPDPASAADVTQNLLLSNVGVPDKKNGLNTIASFSVVR